jgi:hypothetical protein
MTSAALGRALDHAQIAAAVAGAVDKSKAEAAAATLVTAARKRSADDLTAIVFRVAR